MTALEVQFKMKDNGVFQRLTEHGDRFGPYAGATMRRSFFAYRRMFIRGQHKSNPVKFGRGRGSFNSPAKPNAKARNQNSFLIETKPKNEKTARLKDLEVAFFTYSTVARALETGARVKPRGGRRWLTIPVGVAVKPNGKTKRYWSSPAMLQRHRTNIKIRFARRRSSSTAFLLVDVGNVGGRRIYGPQRQRRRRQRKSRWRVAWMLVPRAKIPARLGFLTGWDRHGPKIFSERLRQETDRYLREVWGQR